jgi:hypothetical protein
MANIYIEEQQCHFSPSKMFGHYYISYKKISNSLTDFLSNVSNQSNGFSVLKHLISIVVSIYKSNKMSVHTLKRDIKHNMLRLRTVYCKDYSQVFFLHSNLM